VFGFAVPIHYTVGGDAGKAHAGPVNCHWEGRCAKRRYGMTPFLPDWMFAAFAIGGWELFDLVARWSRQPQWRYVGGAIVCVCLVTLGIRYIARYVRRRLHPPPPEDPDEWKNY
jgi:uncharacterized membrane protein YcjF (UPF0283 family)